MDVWCQTIHCLSTRGGDLSHNLDTFDFNHTGKIRHQQSTFQLLFNLFGHNLQVLQYKVFHWNKCNTAPEVKRWLTHSPTMMCVGVVADRVRGHVTGTRHLLQCLRLPRRTRVYRINRPDSIRSKQRWSLAASGYRSYSSTTNSKNLGVCLF